MFKKLKEFIRQISIERDMMIGWSLNKVYWRPLIKRVIPGTIKNGEVTVQPRMQWVSGDLIKSCDDIKPVQLK